ncbi:MAG TPA: mechanosensitive ion channel domain-containing protein [Rhodanobacteraceae bacterium]|nr:mechanosensitive ion channel domain-containing protein [Rhodanobacteraceae bacterium]
MAAAAATPLQHASSASGGGAPHSVARAFPKLNDFLAFRLVDASGIEITVGTLLAGILILVAIWVLTRIVGRAFVRYGARHQSTHRALIYTVSRVTNYLLLVIGILVALAVAGVPMSKFGLFVGALGVGLGFGLQTIFNNFVSGLIILFERNLKVGDFVELASGVHGTVRDIQIRATRITTNDNIDILVPNSEFVSAQLVNWTLREASRRLHVPFKVAYGTDKAVVQKAGLEAAAAVPFTQSLDGMRAPQVWLMAFDEYSMSFALVVWLTADATKRVRGVLAAYNWALHDALEKYGVEIPVPRRDVRMRDWSTLRDQEARNPSDGPDD